MTPSLLFVDDFLSDPIEARRRALALTYDAADNHGNYAGLTSTEAFRIDGLDRSVSRLASMPLKAAPGTSHGHCRLTLKADKGRSGVHIDPCHYSGILFLNAPEHCKGGTDFFRHRRTGLEQVPTKPAEMLKAGYSDPNDFIEDVVNRDSLVVSRWERVMRVPMRFNRLVLFSPWLFHNAAPGFGTDTATGRLVYLMFFNRAVDAGRAQT